jgi:hypothetical protein
MGKKLVGAVERHKEGGSRFNPAETGTGQDDQSGAQGQVLRGICRRSKFSEILPMCTLYHVLMERVCRLDLSCGNVQFSPTMCFRSC